MRSFARVGHAAMMLAAAAVGAPLGAQISAAADLGAMMHRTGPDLWRSTSRIDPTLRVDGRWAQFSGDADVWSGADGLHLQHGAVDLLAAPAPVGPFRLTTTAHVERFTPSPLAERTAGSIESALSVRVASGGGWLGVAAERAGEIDSTAARPLLRVGLWQRFGMMTVTLSAESHRAQLGGRPPTRHSMTLPGYSGRDSVTGDSVFFPARTTFFVDSGSPSRQWRWSDVQARIGWTEGRVSFDGRIGLQQRVDVVPRSLWGRAVATVALAPRLSLVAGAGVQPASLWQGAPATRFMSLGLRVAPMSLVHPAPPPFVRPTAASFVIHRVEGDTSSATYVVAVRVPGARVVEISGDFNGWHPVALHEMRPDVWETTLVLASGTHRVNLRTNGDRWVAPPGLPTADDDFNGTVGLIVVP